LDTEEEIVDRETNVVEALHSLKADLKYVRSTIHPAKFL